MKKIRIMGLLLLIMAISPGCAQSTVKIAGPLPSWQDKYSPDQVETAVFAGGCFWGVEAVFEQLQGVLQSESGYSGGKKSSASYNMVGTGLTNHAESVRVIYDPDKISYEKLLEIFFLIAHDPTQLNYQGPDRGREYRSVVFYGNRQQEKSVRSYIKKLEFKGHYKDPIVTEVVPLKEFYPAEDYHQDFLRLHPKNSYIVYWDIPKLEALQKNYGELLR